MEPSTINNRYRVVRELARGGMGRVFLVEDTHFGDRKMALKTMLPGVTSPEFLERFRVEFAGLAKLTHPNIAAAYDFGQIAATGEHFFTSELISGVDLYSGTVDASVDQLLSVITQLLRGLDFIHSHKLLHNDLKPSNILLEPAAQVATSHGGSSLTKLEGAVFGRASQVRLIDFGLLSAENTAWGKLLGTPHYMSPERIRCVTADRRSDLYSAGVVIYTICAHSLPFNAQKTSEYLKKHLEEQPPSLALKRPDLPRPVVDLVDRLLRKSPDERFASADAAIKFVDESLSSTSVVEVRTSVKGLAAGSLVGREEEVKVLESLLDKAVKGESESPCGVVEGAPGSGKTRLVEELRGAVQVRGGAFISVSGAAVEGHLRSVAEAVLRGLETIGASDLGALASAISGSGSASGSDLADGLERFVLDQASQRPILIHFDDFQNASQTVNGFVLGLLHSAHNAIRRASCASRLLLIVSQRSTGCSSRLSMNGFPTITLHPFEDSAARSFIQTLFAQDDIPGEVAGPLLKIAAGNPGLLLELAKELVERGLVRHNGTRWIFPSTLDEVPLPTSLGGIFEERLRGLDAASKSLLEWLSCSPDSLSTTILCRCASMELRELLPRLQSLAARAIVKLEDGGQDSCRRVALAHQDLQKCASKEIPLQKLKFMHQRIAQAIEEETGEAGANDERICESLAYHWLEAGNTPGFLRYAPRAVASLQRGGNFAQATSYHKRIADSMPADAAAKKIQSLARLSEMHELLWDLGATRADLESMLELGKNLLRPADRSAIHRKIACLEIACNSSSRALVALAEARRLLGTTNDEIAALGMDAPEAWAAWFSGDKERGTLARDRAEKTLRACSPKSPKERALAAGAANLIASFHHQLGHLTQAHETYSLQLRFLEGLGSLQAEAATRSSLGWLLLDLGEADQALKELTRSLDLARQAGDRRTMCRARERLGEYHLRHGDIKSALLATQTGLQDAETLQSRPAQANALRTLARIYLRAGQDADAARAAREALELHMEQKDLLGIPISRIELARVHLAQGEPAEAREQAEAARVEARSSGLALAEGLALLVLAEAAAKKDDRPEESLLEAASEIFRACGYKHELCETQAVACMHALGGGDLALASKILESLGPWAGSSGSQEQRLRVQLMEAFVNLEKGNVRDAVRSITEIESRARNAVLPRIAKKCKDAIRQIRVETQAG